MPFIMEDDLRNRKYLNPREVIKAVHEIHQYYDSLKPSLGQYATATDRTELFALSGRIHIPSRGKEVQVIIWMPKQFPRGPPLIYIQKPAACLINPASHLDLSGLVRHEYLRQWNHTQSSLADFIQLLMIEFTENLPIFSLEKFNLPKRVRDNIVDLLKQFPEFKVDLQVHDKKEMLVIKGFLEVRERDITHIRRIEVWMPEEFPTGPPLVYVHPPGDPGRTPGKETYNHCKLEIPYLRDWHHRESCLQFLINVINIECAEKPSATVARTTEHPTRGIKRPPWMMPPRENKPEEQVKSTDKHQATSGIMPVSTSNDSNKKTPPTQTPSQPRSVADIVKKDSPKQIRCIPEDIKQSEASASPPEVKASKELLEFAAKSGLSEDTIRQLTVQGFRHLRPVLAMKENDLDALNLSEMAQKVLLREGIKDLQHMEVECYSHTGKSSDIPATKTEDISETIADLFGRAFRNLFDDYLVDERHISLGEKIGQGEYGIVYKGTYDNPHSRVQEDVAVKTLSISSAAEPSIDNFVQEIIKMRPLKHKHIMEMKGIAFKLNKPCCIMPYMKNGDLRSYIRNPRKSFNSHELLTLALEVAEGMHYLSEHNFIHGDLAARNCLVDSSGTVKVADFGLSRQLFLTDYFKFDTAKGQPARWMAIEALTQFKYTRESDRWSFGVMLWELMTRGERPYPGMSTREVIFMIRDNGYRMPRPDHVNKEVYEMMLACWDNDGLRRPTFGEICTIITSWITPDTGPVRWRPTSEKRRDRSPMGSIPARDSRSLPANTSIDGNSPRLNSGYLKPLEIGLGNMVLEQSNRTGPARCVQPDPSSGGGVSSTGSGQTFCALGGMPNRFDGLKKRKPPPPPPPRTDSELSTHVSPPHR